MYSISKILLKPFLTRGDVMKLKLLITISVFLFINAQPVFADGSDCEVKVSKTEMPARTRLRQGAESLKIDRSSRTNPYPATPFSAIGGGEASRYRTDQGWSRGRSSWWWGRSRSDIPTSGYTSPRGN